MTTAPSNANTSGLAPCPFCGGAPGIWQAMGETWVVCGSCLASTQSKGRESVAFDLWNRRAAPASPLPGGGWQDIGTAPRNGDEFQAWWKGTWQPRARFDPEYGSFQLWGRTDFDTEGWEVFEIDGYWQPQPAAPTGAK